MVSANLVQTAAGPRLDLSPSLGWLQDPATVYPVTIDPSIAKVGGGSDTYVQDNIATSLGGAINLKVGESNGHATRSYLKFTGLSAVTGKHVTAATLSLWNNDANSCTPATVHGYPLTSAFSTSSTVWSNKPTYTTSSSYAASASFAHGVDGSCPNAFASLDLTKMVAAWAAGTITDYGVQLSGTETAGAQYWNFCSLDYDPNATGTTCNTAAHVPVLSVTYNSYPGTGGSRTVAPHTSVAGVWYTNTTTPQLTGTVGDADGGSMRYDYEVYSGTSPSPTTLVASGSVNGAAGTAATWTVPAGKLAGGSSYEWRLRGYDGVDYGAWPSTYQAFTVDTTAPAAPSVSSSTWTSGGWSSATSGTISWSATGATSYQYQVDGGPWTPTTSTSQSFTLATGAQHTVSVQAIDIAGNVSAATAFTFGIGVGALTSPADGASTTRRVLLNAAGPSSTPYVAYEWRLGETGAWQMTSVSDITNYVSGAHPATWPWTFTGIGFVWDLATGVGGTDGPIQLQACFSASASGASPACQATPVTVQYSAGSFGAADASQQVGPGELSLVTGDYSVSAGDVNVPAYNGGLSLGRSFTTLDPAAANSGATGVFGPGWTASLDGPDAGDAALIPYVAPDKSYLNFKTPDGDELTYTATSSLTADPITYTGTAEASVGVSTATLDAAGTAITLTESDGTTTTWTQQDGGWAPASVVASGDAAQNTSSYYYATTGATVGLPMRIVAPYPAGVDCSSQSKADTTEGCRSLTFSYTSVTVGGVSAQRLAEVDLVAWDPATAAMTTTAVADYDYDSNGRLSHEWDPRITPVLKTGYSYDSNGRLATITPPGLAAWTLDYDSSGRLDALVRPDPSGQNAVTTIVYDVPISGASAPINMSYGAVAAWGQYAEIPVSGTAIFPPDYVPAGNTPATLTGTDWPHAAITYLDFDGDDVDDAAYGAGAWQIGSTMYNAVGQPFWTLTPGNRAQALTPTADTDPYVAALTSSATRAAYLASWTWYDDLGDPLYERGPTHPVTLGNGSVIDAADGTAYVYDQGAPNGDDHTTTDPNTGDPIDLGPYDLQTAVSTYAYGTDGTVYDNQISTTGYDPIESGDPSGWDLGAPTSQTDPGGLVTKTRYNTAGQVIEQRLPGDPNGTGPRTTLTTYYTTGSGSGCANTAFIGQVCTTAPAAQPATGDPLPVVSYSYDMYGNVTSKVETYGTGSGQVTRTTAVGYDAAERETSSSITVSPSSAGGTPLPAVHYAYDPDTGLPTTTSTGSGAGEVDVTTGYDDLGQPTSYTDASNNTSTTSYDLDGRVTSVDDGVGTTSYTYDSSTEHRGLVTSEDIGITGAPSTFTASYDPDGNLTVETYPNGLTATADRDNDGEPTVLTYAKSGTTWMTFSQAVNAHDQIAAQTSPASSQNFTYDASDRLTTVDDSVDSVCATRVYAFDTDSNRTSLDSYPAATDGTCTTSTTPTTTGTSYDQADRDTNTGYTYDALGRTLTIPAADAQGIAAHASITGTLTVGYYADDLVASQTQGGASMSYTLDPLQSRIATSSDGTTTTTDHYRDGTDSSAWESTSATNWTRNLLGIDGTLVGTADQANTVTLDLTNLHGDIVATSLDSATADGVATYSETTEYGAPRAPTAATTPYGWLGVAQRNNNTLGGQTIMGVRLYNDTTGRFLSTDPIQGGNDNAYSYPDPVNLNDLGGECASGELSGSVSHTQNLVQNHITRNQLTLHVKWCSRDRHITSVEWYYNWSSRGWGWGFTHYADGYSTRRNGSWTYFNVTAWAKFAEIFGPDFEIFVSITVYPIYPCATVCSVPPTHKASGWVKEL